MSVDKNKLIKNYFNIYEAEYPSFRKAAKYGTGFLILGSLMFYMQNIEVLRDVNIIALVFILIGIMSFWLWIRPYFFLKNIFYTRPADGDMDTWFLEDLHNIVKPKALEQLRINESSLKDENIIIIPYPIYYKQASVPDGNIYRRAGDDGLYTYSVWAVQILIVTENFISYYSCTYDWINDAVSNERTNEYFFEDISSVRNDIEFIDNNFINDENKKIGDAKVFKLTNMSGDYLTIITEIPSMQTPSSYINNMELLVQALRVMLRNRRFGEEIEPAKASEEVEFEVENSNGFKPPLQSSNSKEDIHYFHQQLRRIYDDYSKDLEIQKKEYRNKKKQNAEDRTYNG